MRILQLAERMDKEEAHMLASFNQVTKKFKQHEAVKDLSFEVQGGRCIALLGPNGAGKTTTLQMLAGLMEPSSGKVVFSG